MSAVNNASLPVHPFDSSSIDQVSLNVIHSDHINNHVNEPERVIPVNDECTSHGSDNSTTFNSDNPVSSEISTNVDSSMLNAMQDSNLRGNQHDLNTNPDNKESANQNINPEESRHLNPEKGTIPCPFLKRRGWCVKGTRCDFKQPRDDEKHLVLCPFLQKRGNCLKGSCCVSLIAIAIRIVFHLPDWLTTSVLPLFFTITDLHRSRKIHHAG